MNTAAPTPYDAAEAADSWTVEYLPYTAQDGHEIPAYRVADADGTAICETNENAPTRYRPRTPN